VLLERFGDIARDLAAAAHRRRGWGATDAAVLPEGTAPGDVEIVVIVDPIDGTRGLMYQKRPAWVLTGVRRPAPGTRRRWPTSSWRFRPRCPLVKQNLCDALWAIAGAAPTASGSTG
jgi:hypothetical protein